MTKEGFTKIINFMTPGAGVPLLERGENVIIIVKIPLPPSQPCLSLGRHWFSRGDNFQCYPLVQSIFNSVLQYRLRSTTPLHSTPLHDSTPLSLTSVGRDLMRHESVEVCRVSVIYVHSHTIEIQFE